MKLNDRISETSYFTWLDLIKIWGSIFIVTAIVGGCSYWLEQDDKRMHDDFMNRCEQKKTENKTDNNCTADWRKAYRETFGRNP